ncbi:DNA recombination protein RmuC, partial [Candidatus Gracilibacteria bacterium]|nr:DNA recombination protein RmuC [Candidatus Gracilibacteria bacterium]
MELFLIIITLALLAYLIIRLHDLQQSMKNDVHGSVQFSSEQLRNSNQLIANVTEKLVTIEQSQQQVLSFAGQLQRLEQVFQNPKRRGLIGEYMLAEQLREILPRHTYD